MSHNLNYDNELFMCDWWLKQRSLILMGFFFSGNQIFHSGNQIWREMDIWLPDRATTKNVSVERC